MSQYKDAAIGDTVHFWFAANLTTGAAGDGATPLYDVRLAGAAAGAAPVLSGTPTLLSHADYTDGLHEIAVAATEGNGFAAGNEYAVFCTLTISTVNPAGFVGSFKLVASGDTLHAAAATLMDRILGTLDTGTHKPQSGDAYVKVNDGTIGLANLKALIDAIQADIGDASASTLGSLYAILGNAAASIASRLPAALDGSGNMKSQVKGQDNIDFGALQKESITAAVPTTAQIKSAMEAAGGYLALILEDTGTILPGTLSTIAGYVDTEITQIINAIAALTAPDNATIGNIYTAIAHATYGLAALKTLIDAIGAKTTNLPANPAAVGSQMDLVNTPNATAIAALQNGLATSAALALAKTILDHLATMIELDGEVYRLTVNALEMSPAGEGGGNTIIFPVMQGQVYTATAVQKRTVEIIRGDTPTISFNLGADYTGWTPYFGAKSALADTTYAINPKSGSWVNAALGTGTVELTATETATAGQYYAEIELRRGESKLTAMQYLLTILEDVIK
jgi:hypothetical protein